jgi:hypothetical protein
MIFAKICLIEHHSPAENSSDPFVVLLSFAENSSDPFVFFNLVYQGGKHKPAGALSGRCVKARFVESHRSGDHQIKDYWLCKTS